MPIFKSSIINSLLANLLSKGINICSQLILIPLYLKFWGKDYYGEWLLLSIIPNYLTLSDFGLNVTAVTEMCKLVIEKKYAEALIIYQSVNGFFLILSSIVVVLFTITISVINLKSFFNFKLITDIEVCISIFFLVLTVFISIFWGTLIGIFRAEGRFDKQINYTNLASIFDILIIIFVLLDGYSLVYLVTLQALIRIILFIILVKIISEKYYWFRFGITFDLLPVKKIIPTSIYYMLLTFGHAMVLQGSAFIVGKHLGINSLVTFNTIRTLVNSIKSFSGVIYMSYVPEFTKYLFKRDAHSAKKSFKRMMSLVGLQALIMGLFLFFFGGKIFNFWTGNKLKLINPFYNYMLVSIVFQSLWNAASMVPLSINKNNEIKLYAPLSVIFILILNFIVKYNNLESLGISMVIFDMILFGYMLYIAKKLLSIKT